MWNFAMSREWKVKLAVIIAIIAVRAIGWWYFFETPDTRYPFNFTHH